MKRNPPPCPGKNNPKAPRGMEREPEGYSGLSISMKLTETVLRGLEGSRTSTFLRLKNQDPSFNFITDSIMNLLASSPRRSMPSTCHMPPFSLSIQTRTQAYCPTPDLGFGIWTIQQSRPLKVLAASSRTCFAWGQYRSVSYTHLDVYKRQPQPRPDHGCRMDPD